MAKRLRSGYTTGACAAAAVKGAALFMEAGSPPETVEIPFPDGGRHRFVIHRTQRSGSGWQASVIKDAGDDPDVTNGAEIAATVSQLADDDDRRLSTNCIAIEGQAMVLCGGEGVGRVTKPGLAVKVNEPAINPVPRRMIAAAVGEVLELENRQPLLVTISIPRGKELAGRTLNYRLGISGGLSILGTTGIVRPVSAEAWTATIRASLSVARAIGLREVVLSTGRTSEKGVQARLDLPEEAYAMMGDYLGFSLKEAAAFGFSKIIVAGMWAKVMKAALRIPQTHVRHGALEVAEAAALLGRLGAAGSLQSRIEQANTAREIYGHLVEAGRDDLVEAVCRQARTYAEQVSGVAVSVCLVDSGTRVVICV